MLVAVWEDFITHKNPPTCAFYPSRLWSQCLSLSAALSNVKAELPWGSWVIKECVWRTGDQGRHVCRKSPVAALRASCYNWYSTVCGIFQLLAGKHRVVVNHSSAAVQVVSAWELGRDELLPSGARQGYFWGSAIYAETQGSCLPNPQESERHSFSWWSPQGEDARGQISWENRSCSTLEV